MAKFDPDFYQTVSPTDLPFVDNDFDEDFTVLDALIPGLPSQEQRVYPITLTGVTYE